MQALASASLRSLRHGTGMLSPYGTGESELDHLALCELEASWVLHPLDIGWRGLVEVFYDREHEVPSHRVTAPERLTQVESHSDNVDDLLSFSTMTLEETREAAHTPFDMMEKVDAKHLMRLKSLCN